MRVSRGTRGPGRTRPLAALALIGGSVLATALALEVGLRLAPASLRGYSVVDRRYVQPREFAAERTRNSLGYHDVEHPKGRSGRVRVALVGDSYVEAASVPLDETVGRRLERYLNDGGAERFEVLAIGHSGWGPERELKALEEAAPSYPPDVVVTLFLPLNDILDSSPELCERQKRITVPLLRHRPGWLALHFEDAPALLFESSELNRFLSLRLDLILHRFTERRLGEAGIPVAYEVYRTDYDEAWNAAWARVEELIEETRRYAEQIHARYVLVSASTPQGVLGARDGLELLERAYPAMRSYTWDLDKADRLIEQICRRHGVPVLLLEPRFREIVAHGDPLHWAYDGHWNAEGNDRAARAIAGFLTEGGGG